MLVKCEKYPELYLYDINVRFCKGRADVEDLETLQILQRLDEYGFVFDGEIPQAEKPLSGMKKAELLAVAAEKGIEIPKGATNAEIIVLIEGGEPDGETN